MTRLMLTIAAFLSVVIVPLSHAVDDDVEAGTIGTGIMGVITGLGSIHVNGFRIEVPRGMVASSSLGDRPSDALKIGETVFVEAALTDGGLIAQRILNYYPLVAPIDAVSPGRLRVMGLDLDVSEVDLTGLAAGTWVAVSGVWRGDTVVVSDLRQIAAREDVVINASFSETATGVQKVGPFALHRRYVAHAASGDQFRVIGTWSPSDKTIMPKQIEAGLFSRTGGTLFIEGYMSRPDRRGAYSVYGSGIVVFTDDPDMALPTERSVFCVDQTGPVSITQSVELDMAPDQRRQALQEKSLDARIRAGDLRCG